MNSFKKIALVMVATMTMATLSVLPANAAVSTTLKVSGSAVLTGTTALNPTLIPVPSENTISSEDALQIAVAGLDTNTVVSAVASNGRIVPALATVLAPVNASSGSSSLVINTGTGSTADFFVYTTNTNGGTVSVTIGANTTTYYFKGTVGELNSISLTTPATAVAGTVEKVTLSGVDVFGNAKGGAVIILQVISSTSTTVPYVTEIATTATTVLGSKTVDVSIPASGTITLVATASVASPVLGLATPVSVVIKTITVRDVLSELASVKAELAAAKAELAVEKAAHEATKKSALDAAAKAVADASAAKALADKALAEAIEKGTSDVTAVNIGAKAMLDTYKARYNALAKKWNKYHSVKVALIK